MLPVTALVDSDEVEIMLCVGSGIRYVVAGKGVAFTADKRLRAHHPTSLETSRSLDLGIQICHQHQFRNNAIAGSWNCI